MSPCDTSPPTGVFGWFTLFRRIEVDESMFWTTDDPVSLNPSSVGVPYTLGKVIFLSRLYSTPESWSKVYTFRPLPLLKEE